MTSLNVVQMCNDAPHMAYYLLPIEVIVRWLPVRQSCGKLRNYVHVQTVDTRPGHYLLISVARVRDYVAILPFPNFVR